MLGVVVAKFATQARRADAALGDSILTPLKPLQLPH